jgi:hypothetical protein
MRQELKEQFLRYEINSSVWAPYMSGELLQGLAGRYFAWKVRRKLARYEFRLRVADVLLSDMSEAWKYNTIYRLKK